MKHAGGFAAMLLVFCQFASPAQTGDKPAIEIRGRAQNVYYYPASSKPPRGKILFAPGDGGWRGFAVEIAQEASSWGYDVYGFDTKHYLESFTGKTMLSEADVMKDMRSVASAIRSDAGERVIFIGWSEGAGLGVLQAAAGLEVGVTAVTLAPADPLFRRASVRVTAWPVLAVELEGVSVGARTAAACTVTGAPVTAGPMLAPLTASIAATVAP